MKDKKWIGFFVTFAIVSLMLPACATPTPEVVEKVVTQVVRETVIVAGTPQVIEKEVTKVVEVEKVITATPMAGPKHGGTLKFAGHRDVNNFDPNRSGGTSNSWFLGNIFDTLVTYDLEGNFTGALAESWDQPDDKTYVFKLRQGVKFSDGTDFDVEDVVATLDRIKAPETAAVHQKMVADLETIEALDAFTLRVTLREPDVTFLHALADVSMYIMSADDVRNEFDTPDNYNGTGPFVLESWEPERQYVLKKNRYYWKEGLPYLDELIIMPIRDERARIDALRSGEVDIAEYIPWQAVSQLEEEGFQVFPHHGLNSFIRLNHTRPPLDNKKFRQALAYVIDRQEVNDLAFGGLGWTIPGGPLQPQDSPFYFKELEGYYEQDWDKARALLKEAGFDSPADVPLLEYSSTVGAVSGQPAQVVLQQMEEFGLKAEWRTVDVPTLVSNRSEGTYQLHHDGGGMSWPDPDYLRKIFHSEYGTIYALGVGYKNEELDRLLEQGHRTIDLEERRKIYLEVEKILLDDVPWIWVCWRYQAEGVNDDYVKGYEAHPSALWKWNVNRFEYIWLDK
jgi:ABC-type transport system substrate-binding protein